MRLAKGDHHAREPERVAVRFEAAPVQPARLVVLVVGVVVAALRVEKLVPGAQYRRAVREQKQAQEVLRLALARSHHFGRGAVVPLPAAVAAEVVVRPVGIVVTVRLVALALVRDEVPQGEAIVGCHEVHALIGVVCVLAIVGKEVLAAVEPPHQRRDYTGIPAYEPAQIVAKAAVPLRPRRPGEGATELVGAGRVPGFGDQAHSAESGIGRDVPEDRRIFVPEGAVSTREHRGQVEAKAVHAHVASPVAQTVQDHPSHVAVAAVQAVARAGEVRVGSLRPAGHEVVRVGVQPLEAVDGSSGVAFAGVVVDDVEHHLEPGGMESPHQLPELGVLVAHAAAVRVRAVGSEEADPIVAPVVALVRVELEHGHELHHGDAELEQVGNLADQPLESTATLRGHARARMSGEAADVKLIDHRIGLVTGRAAIAPVEGLAVGSDQA